MTLACEDLATKAELEELKEQLNQLLGKKSDGGEINVIEQGDFEGTLVGEKLELANTAIQDIELHDGGGSQVSLVDDIALLGLVNGTHEFVKTQGNTVTKPLSFLTETTKKTAKTLIQNKSVGKVTTAAGQVAGKSLSILTSLLSIVTSLGLNIATVKTLGFRIDQIEKAVISWNQDYANLIRLLTLSDGKLDKANLEILKSKKIITDQQQQITTLEDDLANSNNIIEELSTLIDQAYGQIEELQEVNENLQQQITDFEGEVTEEIEALQDIISNTNQELEAAKTKITDLTKANQKLSDDIEELKKRNKNLKDKLKKTTIVANNNSQEITKLKQEIADNKTLTDTKLKTIEAKLILAEDALKKGNSGGGGFPVSAKTEVANTQQKTLELTNLLAGNPFSNSQLQIDPYSLGENNPFTEIFSQLIPQINTTNPEVNPMQLEEITTTIQETIQTKFDDIGLGNIPGDVTTIKNNTTPEKIKQNVDESICKQTQPEKCIEKNIKQPLEEQINNTYNNLNVTLLAIPNLFSDCCDLMAQKIQELEELLTKAWNSTTEDKKINAINNTLLLHNAMLLSQDINQTIPKVQNFSLPNIAPTDYQENPLELATKISEILSPIPDSISNLDNSLSLQSTLTSYNQTIQSAHGTIFAIENAKTSTLEGLKTLGNYTSTLGNLMQIQGLLESNSFPWMWEDFNLETALDGLIGKYYISSEIIEDISSLSIQGLPVIENANQAIAENQEFISLDAKIEQLKADYSLQRQELENSENIASLSPEIDRLDLIKLEPEEYGG